MKNSFVGTKSELIYFIYFALLFGARAIGLYDGQPVYNAILVIGMVLFVTKIFLTEHTLAEYVMIGLFMLLGGTVYLCSGEKGLLVYFTMMLGMKYVRSEKVMKLGLTILSVAYAVLYLLSVSGVISELNHINKRSGVGYVMRHSLGYPYPNTAHTTFLVLVMFFIYLYKTESVKKIIFTSVMFTILNIYLYFYTFSLTGLISVSIYLVVNLYIHIRKRRSRAEDTLIFILFPAVVIFSILGPILATGDVFTFLNKLLHKRYEYALYFLENEKITAFGSRFNMAPSNWYMIDNSFLYLFLQLGVIPFIIVCSLYLKWIHTMIKEKRDKELAIMITFCMIGMSDPFLFNLSYKNLTFIFLGQWIYREMDGIAERLPALLQKTCRMLPDGDSEVTLGVDICEAFADKVSFIGREFTSHVVIYTAVFLIFGAAVSCTYYQLTPSPDILYVDKDTVDPYFSKKSVSLTEEEVQQELAKGNYIHNYVSKDEPMYVLKGSAPRVEYQRKTLTAGVLGGALMCFVSMIGTIVVRKRRETGKC